MKSNSDTEGPRTPDVRYTEWKNCNFTYVPDTNRTAGSYNSHVVRYMRQDIFENVSIITTLYVCYLV